MAPHSARAQTSGHNGKWNKKRLKTFSISTKSLNFATQIRKVAQLVAHYVRDVGVGRSSRLFPTESGNRSSRRLPLLCMQTQQQAVSRAHACTSRTRAQYYIRSTSVTLTLCHTHKEPRPAKPNINANFMHKNERFFAYSSKKP